MLQFTIQPWTAVAQTNELDLARIDAYVRQQVARHGIPGLALGIVDGNQIVHLQGYGKADQTGRAVTPQTPFLLASVSKPLTALAVMQLVEAGQVALDEPVQRYLPEFRMLDASAAQITVRQLLEHTSGIPATSCDTRIDAETLAQYVAELQTVALAAPVGARHDYCSGNYNVLGRMIEVVSGQTFAAYMQQHVFDPLAMRHSFTSETEALADGLAQGYQWLFGVVVPTHFRYNPSQMPSGFLISSAEDMTHFLIAHLNGGRFEGTAILSSAGIDALQAPGVPIGTGEETYGLGWRVGAIGGMPAIYHPGDNYNYHTMLLMLPESRRGAVLLMNSNNLPAAIGAYQDLETGVPRLLAGQEPAPESMRLGQLYLLIDLPLALTLALALWPLMRLRRWYQSQQQRQQAGQLRQWRLGLRIAWELGFPLALLIGTRLLLHGMGAQSWIEGLSLIPDFGLWLWTLCILMLLAGVLHLTLWLRLRRRNHRQPA